MFPKELLGEGPGSVYLFLMKPAVALMADIFNSSPSHTENTINSSLVSVGAHSHSPPHLQPRSQRPIQPTPSFLFLFCLYNNLHIYCVQLHIVMQSNEVALQWTLPVWNLYSHNQDSLFFSGPSPPSLGAHWNTLEFTLEDDIWAQLTRLWDWWVFWDPRSSNTLPSCQKCLCQSMPPKSAH